MHGMNLIKLTKFVLKFSSEDYILLKVLNFIKKKKNKSSFYSEVSMQSHTLSGKVFNLQTIH